MSAGTAYAKRYPGGFLDLPATTTAIDSAFLNAVEAALLQLIGAAPNADAQVMQWDNANTRFGPALLLNKNIDPAAAIAKSKLDFTGANGIVNADVAGAAAIARSKLDFGAGLVNADISAAAAIASSKFADPVVRGLYRKTTAKAVNTTVAATDLLNGEITIGAGVMGTTGAVRLTAWGDWLQNSGGAAALPRLSVSFGGSTLADIGASGAVTNASAARSSWEFSCTIMNTAANAQVGSYRGMFCSSGGFSAFSVAPAVGGDGQMQNVYNGSLSVQVQAGGVILAGAVNTAVAQTLALNVINGSASASYETKLLGALVEVL